MNDLERARAMREASDWDQRQKLAVALASLLVTHLPRGMLWSDRFAGMMLAILACADTLKFDRADVIAAFTKLAHEAKELEIKGLEVLDG